MMLQFRNRAEAGQQLAWKLTHYADRHDVLLLALPRGGVPVAYEVAQVIHAPLDIFVVRERDNLPRPEVEGRIVILIDDGIATGSTKRAAVQALRQLRAGRIVVASPVAALCTVRQLRPAVDEIVAVITPASLTGVGQWYADFTPTTDDEVRRLLEDARRLDIIATGA